MNIIIQSFAMIADAFGKFFSSYALLDVALGISGFACVAIAFWSVVRFLVLPLVGGHYSINDGESDILVESVTETVSTASPKQYVDGKTVRHTRTQTSTRTHRKKVK